MDRTGPDVAVAALAVAATFLIGVLLRPVLPVDETRYLAVAWEMHLSGNWLVPHLNGALYTHKPPLLFWIVNLVWSVTGVSGTAARLVAPAFAVGCVLLLPVAARTLWPEDRGLGGRAAILLAGLFFFGIYGGLTMFDSMLAFATLVGIVALARAVGTRRRRWWVVLGAAVALGVLAKGPVILIHLGPALVLAPLWISPRERWPARGLALGGLLALGVGFGIVALWLVPAIVAGGPEYRTAVLWTQSAGRVVDAFAHGRPVWFFVALLPVLLWPWFWTARAWAGVARLRPFSDRGIRLCLVWALGALVAFSLISSKQIHYLLPEMPAVALILARAMPQPGLRRVSVLPAMLPLGILGVAALATGAGLLDPGDAAVFARPPWAMMLAGAGLLVLAGLALRWPRQGVLMAASLGTVCVLDALVAASDGSAMFDASAIAAEIARYPAGEVAFYGETYQGEFTFAARLTAPLANPVSATALAEWRQAHPGGLVLAQTRRMKGETAPERTIDFNERTYGFWPVAPGT